MNFCEAMDALKSGKKVTRNDWKDGLYFVKEGEEVVSYQPIYDIYQYNETIMVSNGWMVEGETESKDFCQIISSLQDGKKAWMKDWDKEFYIYLDSDKKLVIHKMLIFLYHPSFDDFRANDWIEIE